MARCDNCCLPAGADPDRGDDQRQMLCESCKALAESNCPIRITPLERDGLELVMAWRSNPRIYHHFRRQNSPLGWDEHVAWFESRNPDRYDFVIHYDGRRVGVVSIDSDDDVGIYLGDFSARGHGVATKALDWLCNRFQNRAPLFAEIHKDNSPSKRLFSRCGFQQIDIDGDWLQFTYDP